MSFSLPVLAGLISTVIFATSTLPMLGKAWRTRDLHSYSLGTISLANAGNVIHSVYVFSLPMGPIWVLHTFHLTTTGLMLVWYLLFEWKPRHVRPIEPAVSVDAVLDDLLMIRP
jgi:hypothetical protein